MARDIGLVLWEILEICSVIDVSQRHWPEGMTNKLGSTSGACALSSVLLA